MVKNKKVYCKNCKYLRFEMQNKYDRGRCTHPSNIEEIDKSTYLEEIKEIKYISPPCELNKNNNCIGYKDKMWCN